MSFEDSHSELDVFAANEEQHESNLRKGRQRSTSYEEPSTSHSKKHIAIKYIHDRSYSIDSTKVCDEFYNDYFEIDPSVPQEAIATLQMYGFVQLDVLSVGTDKFAREWIEISRWIKYQEDLKERACRWDHPCIASLTFNSISSLRTMMQSNGIFLADVKENTFRGILSRAVDEMVARHLIKPKEIPHLMTILLAKHKRVHEKETGWFILKKVVHAMGANSLQSIFDDKFRPKSTGPMPIIRKNSTFSEEQPGFSGQSHSVDDLQPFPRSSSKESPRKCQGITEVDNKNGRKSLLANRKNSLRNLLPPTAEATLIMAAGDIEVIKEPTFVFIRFAQPIVLAEITEVDICARIISLVLVPPGINVDHLEVGRCFGTLMSNTIFNTAALLARGMDNLCGAMNRFLDDSITISPGDWDNYDLLSRNKLQDKNLALRCKRKRSKAPLVRPESFFDIRLTGQATPVTPAASKSTPVLESPFIRTGRAFGGLLNDIKRRYPKYKSDFVDGVNFQCLATVLFMYFASLSQIIPFAVLMGEKTKNLIGISETLLPTAGAGVVFALTAGQPLLLLGTTGPLLIFDEILFKVCNRIDIEFLPTRVWVSIWLVVITVMAEYFEAIVLIKWCTRFTQDIFSVLTSFLLIFECFDSLAKTYKTHPLTQCAGALILSGNNFSSTNRAFYNRTSPEGYRGDFRLQPNTALFCTCLTFGTFFIAFGLREFKTSVYFNEKIRKNLGHFAVPIAIGVMLAVSSTIESIYVPKMKVPKGLQPTCPEERSWLISPTGMQRLYSPWIALAAVLPALLIFVLMFLTTDICELLINTKERRLTKGNGFHLDMLLIAFINFGCGIFGAPWICAPPMRSIAHADALTVYSKTNPPGEKPAFLGVIEQRLTGLVISILIGCSVFMAPLLQRIPLAVLFGIFLYMGVSALHATQLFTRISLLFIPAIHHPNVLFVKKVRTNKMHLYTLVQIACLAALWLVMLAKEAALFFPFILMLLVPARLQLTRIFSQDELAVLDEEIPMKNL